MSAAWGGLRKLKGRSERLCVQGPSSGWGHTRPRRQAGHSRSWALAAALAADLAAAGTPAPAGERMRFKDGTHGGFRAPSLRPSYSHGLPMTPPGPRPMPGATPTPLALQPRPTFTHEGRSTQHSGVLCLGFRATTEPGFLKGIFLLKLPRPVRFRLLPQMPRAGPRGASACACP